MRTMAARVMTQLECFRMIGPPGASLLARACNWSLIPTGSAWQLGPCSEVGSDEDKDLVRGGEAAEVALLRAQDEFGVGQEVDRRLRVLQWDDVVGVAVPPPHRRGRF